MTSEHTHHRRVPQNSDAPLAGRCLVRHCDWSCYSRKSIPGDNSIRARSRTPKTSHPPCVCSSVFCDDPSLTLSGSNFAWSEKSLYYTYKSFFTLHEFLRLSTMHIFYHFGPEQSAPHKKWGESIVVVTTTQLMLSELVSSATPVSGSSND